MRQRTRIHARVMQDEVLEIDDSALAPQRGAGVAKMRLGNIGPGRQARAQPLIKPHERVGGSVDRSLQTPEGE